MKLFIYCAYQNERVYIETTLNSLSLLLITWLPHYLLTFVPLCVGKCYSTWFVCMWLARFGLAKNYYPVGPESKFGLIF